MSQLGMLVELANHGIYPRLPILMPSERGESPLWRLHLSDVSGVLATCDGIVESMGLEVRQSWNRIWRLLLM